MAEQTKSGKTGCLVAVVLGVIGIGVGIWGGVSLFTSSLGIVNDMFSHEYVVPGRHTLDLAKPGPYMIMHEYYAKVAGKTYKNSPNLAINMTITHRETGRNVALREPPRTSQSNVEMPDRKATMVGIFLIDEPGEYVLEASYDNEGPPAVLAIGPAPDKSVATSIAGTACVAFPLAGLTLLGALIFGIIAIVRMSTRKQQRAPTSPYQYPPQ